MLPFFNTSGPCSPGEHYMLPPERRLDDVLELIEAKRFFTLHAGRQTGKTTSLMWLERHLGASARWSAIWVDLEMAREQPDVTRSVGHTSTRWSLDCGKIECGGSSRRCSPAS